MVPDGRAFCSRWRVLGAGGGTRGKYCIPNLACGRRCVDVGVTRGAAHVSGWTARAARGAASVRPPTEK